jgi:hypothetical protein
MSNVGELVEFISEQLNDADAGNENIRWTKDLVRKYITNAVIATASLAPSLFSMPKEITLARDTCVHEICDECDKFGGILAVDGNECSSEKNLGKKHRKLLSHFSDSVCESTSEAYETGGVEFSNKTPCIFLTANKTPLNRDVKALVSCVEYPDRDEMKAQGDDFVLPRAICGELSSAVYEHILYQAREKDLEIDSSQPQQTSHFNRFLLLVRGYLAADDRFEELQEA